MPLAGVTKLGHSALRFTVLAMLAGMYIGFGFSLCMLTGGQMSRELRHEQPGLFTLVYSTFGFPLGLTLVVVAGAELFTSNVAYMTAHALEAGRARWRQSALGWLRVCGASWLLNLCGSLLLVQLMVWGQVRLLLLLLLPWVVLCLCWLVLTCDSLHAARACLWCLLYGHHMACCWQDTCQHQP